MHAYMSVFMHAFMHTYIIYFGVQIFHQTAQIFWSYELTTHRNTHSLVQRCRRRHPHGSKYARLSANKSETVDEVDAGKRSVQVGNKSRESVQTSERRPRTGGQSTHNRMSELFSFGTTTIGLTNEVRPSARSMIASASSTAIFSSTLDLRLNWILLASWMGGLTLCFACKVIFRSLSFPSPEYRLLYFSLRSNFCDSDPATSLGGPTLRNSNFSEDSPRSSETPFSPSVTTNSVVTFFCHSFPLTR